jgi:hypothetical protein
LSGHGVIRLRSRTRRLHLVDARRQQPNASAVEKYVVRLGVRRIGASVPIDADGGGPQRARQASSISFGREGTICEIIIVMQISPVRAMRPGL